MQATITLTRSLSQPLFTIGQRTQQGKIIGINYSTQPSIRTKLLDEQRNLQQLATGDVGLSKATVMSFKFR
jgi:hypothetical protein